MSKGGEVAMKTSDVIQLFIALILALNLVVLLIGLAVK